MAYLAHYGILGQKWGIRRFQNKDGSYTELGKRLRRASEATDPYFRQTIKQGKDKPNISPAEKISKEAKKIQEGASNISGRAKSRKDKERELRERAELEEAMSNMSDAELRSVVNRMNLEDQYISAMSKKNYKNGRASVHEILETFGDVIAVVGGTVGIITAIKAVKSKN